MSCYSDTLKDLCKRTIANLEYIQKSVEINESSAYEVTQLILSCYGVIVNIRESCHEFHKIENQSELVFKNDGFFDIIITPENRTEWGIPEDLRYPNIGIIIYNLRNATSHLGIEPNGDTKKIQRITFEFDEEKPEKGKITFTIKELDTFLKRICKEILI